MVAKLLFQQTNKTKPKQNKPLLKSKCKVNPLETSVSFEKFYFNIIFL